MTTIQRHAHQILLQGLMQVLMSLLRLQDAYVIVTKCIYVHVCCIMNFVSRLLEVWVE